MEDRLRQLASGLQEAMILRQVWLAIYLDAFLGLSSCARSARVLGETVAWAA